MRHQIRREKGIGYYFDDEISVTLDGKVVAVIDGKDMDDETLGAVRAALDLRLVVARMKASRARRLNTWIGVDDWQLADALDGR